MIDHNFDPAPDFDARVSRPAARKRITRKGGDVLGNLAEPVAAPDLTRSIMGRLGYMKVSARVSRRHALRRAAGRLGMLCVALVGVGLGAKVYLEGPRARRPAEITIPAALDNDLRRQHRQFDSVIQMIRSLAPANPDAHESGERGRTVEEPPPQIDEEVNRSSVGAVRWV